MLTSAANYQDLIRNFRWAIPERYNIGIDVCDKWADKDPARLALIHKTDDGERVDYSFADIKHWSNKAANLLVAHGVAAGDRVGILLPQAPETAYSHVAVYKLGGVAVPLFSLFGTEALAYRLGNCEAKAVITDAAGAAKIHEILDKLPALRTVFTIDGAAPGTVDFHRELASQGAGFEPVGTRADDPALIIYTSGTTGQPKGALHAHRVLPGHLPGVEMSHDLFPHPDDRMWTPADWAWIGGLYDVLMPAWHHGVAVVCHRFKKFEPEKAFELIAGFGVRNAFLPPTALKMMRTVKDPETRWTLNMRSVASGGESLGTELLDWGRKTLGLTINEFYGQTECNMIVSSCAAIMDARPGLIGRPVPGHELAIVGDDGGVLPRGELGNIAVKRPDPVMLLQYWANPEATRKKFVGDWLITGDLGVIQEDGYIRYVGRDDDVITSAGYRIGPGEIEDCLLGHKAVKLAAVVGIPDPERTEIVKAFIVLDEGYAASGELIEDIQRHVKVRLAAHEYPREIEFVESLPMTTTGKIIRRELRERRR